MESMATSASTGTPSLDDLFARFRQGDRRALSRLVSLVARGEQVGPILAGVGRAAKPARVVALTGAGGVGKSTLAGKLIETIRDRGLRVAVLACDPQSPLSGGALLGDRFRMPSRPEDDGVFIRSLAAAGGRGALADNLDALTRLLEAFGFDVVLLETVGAGQGDTAVLELADVLVLLVQPETGDDLQWEKAGLLEVADVVVVHKADLPGADRVEAQVLTTLGLSAGHVPPVLRVSARGGSGLDELWDVIAGLPLRRVTDTAERDLLRLGQEALAVRFALERKEGNGLLSELVERWRRGALPAAEAGAALLDALKGPDVPGGDSSPR
jgi:LAO/AO transport system ATPase